MALKALPNSNDVPQRSREVAKNRYSHFTDVHTKRTESDFLLACSEDYGQLGQQKHPGSCNNYPRLDPTLTDFVLESVLGVGGLTFPVTLAPLVATD